MSAFCIHLNDDTPLFSSGYTHPTFSDRKHITVDIGLVNSYWKQRLLDHDLELLVLELFYGPPNCPYTLGIHTDAGNVGSISDFGKINWMFGGEGSTMHWYKIIQRREKEQLKTPVGSEYNLFESDEVQMIHSNVIKNPSIVQAGIPHNIINFEKERWSYSMKIKDNLTNRRVTFGRLKSAFEQ